MFTRNVKFFIYVVCLENIDTTVICVGRLGGGACYIAHVIGTVQQFLPIPWKNGSLGSYHICTMSGSTSCKRLHHLSVLRMKDRPAVDNTAKMLHH